MRIEGKIILDNDEEISFEVTSSSTYGFSQWGNTKEVLGSNVDLMEELDNIVKKYGKDE